MPVRSTVKWRCPELPRDVREQLENALSVIVTGLSDETMDSTIDSPSASPSLFNGTAGFAAFFFYFAKCTGDDRYRERALQLLHRSADSLESVLSVPSFASGFSGVAWLIAHLTTERMLDASDFDLSEIDVALGSILANADVRDFEFMNGLSGLGAYALERARTTADPTLLDGIASRLIGESEIDATGARWFSKPSWMPPEVRVNFPSGYYNLGLAHGGPAVVALFAKICQEGRATIDVEPTLRHAVRWLLSQEFPDDSLHGARFPSVITAEERKPTSLAWCYGDLSIALTVAHAAIALDDLDLRSAATRIAQSAAEQSHDKKLGDACFCHGAAGVAHIFNRLGNSLDSSALRDISSGWYTRILDYRIPTARGGFQFTKDFGGFESRDSVLNGLAGVGLTILGALYGTPPTWDRMFMCDLDVSL
jgi:lantibiotic modifying enzyme